MMVLEYGQLFTSGYKNSTTTKSEQKYSLQSK